MYNKNLLLKDNEVAAKVNIETGEVISVSNGNRLMPEGMKKLRYNNFSILNNEIASRLGDIFTNEEMGVILYMISISEIGTNSLKPLCDEMSLRESSEYLRLNKNRVKSITEKLFRFGVYLSIRIYEDEEKEYWVLNPNISWRGRLIHDSIFLHFKDTLVSRLLS